MLYLKSRQFDSDQMQKNLLLENWTEQPVCKRNIEMFLAVSMANNWLKTNMKLRIPYKQPRCLYDKLFLESLILAQDERWRHA